jgi:cytoskeletal protein CcmA (bactofilin family)
LAGVIDVLQFFFPGLSPRIILQQKRRAALAGVGSGQCAAGQERHVSYFSQTKTGRDGSGHNKTGGEDRPGEAAAVGKNSIDTVSTLGPGMLITGNIVSEGTSQIFGRVIGDIHAVQILIGDGAQVEGNIPAHEVGITGAFKGTIRGDNVRLKGAKVEGEVFSKSLTVEENVQFEGISRRPQKPGRVAFARPGRRLEAGAGLQGGFRFDLRDCRLKQSDGLTARREQALLLRQMAHADRALRASATGGRPPRNGGNMACVAVAARA